MNKKCVVTLLLAMIVCLGLCGCGAKCEYTDCEKEVYEGTPYCAEHACKAPDGCENEALGEYEYCTEHRCTVEDCNNIKAEGEKNCEKHLVCATDGCSNKSFDGSFRCAEHKCTVEDCPGDPTYRDGAPGAYCEDHDCDYDDGYTCLSVAVRGSENYSYCSAHVCKVSDCTNEGDHDGYCDIHNDDGSSSYDSDDDFDYDSYDVDYSYGDDEDDRDTATCKSCGREFPAGDSGKNYMNIAKTGMCKNCYNNYKDMSDWVEGY